MDDKNVFKSNLTKYFYDSHVKSDLTIEELVEDIWRDVEEYLVSQLEKSWYIVKDETKKARYEDSPLTPEKMNQLIKKARVRGDGYSWEYYYWLHRIMTAGEDEIKHIKEGENMHDIKFVSYDGDYPNLCSGTLVVSIDNNIISGQYVLDSGGSCYVTDDLDDHVEEGWWTIETDWLPEEYRTEDVINRITELVNENIPQGCCGGCL